MTNKYTPGQDCGCSAYSESECGCDADWTPAEVYELREQVKHLQSKIEGMGYRHSHLRCQITQAENVTLRVKSRLQSERALADRLAEALRPLLIATWREKQPSKAELAFAAWKEARSE